MHAYRLKWFIRTALAPLRLPRAQHRHLTLSAYRHCMQRFPLDGVVLRQDHGTSRIVALGRN